MNRRINREIQQLKNNSPLEDFFGLNQDDSSKLTIYFKNNNFGIILDIEYLKKNNYFSFDEFPEEINDLINSFNFYSIKIKCILQFPHAYPFNSIKWGLLLVDTNINKTCLNEYYKTIIREHNAINQQYGKPSSSIQNNILDFITKINDFETIINCFNY